MRNWLVVVTCWSLSAAWAQDAIIPVREIKPGMKGYGLTVFHGTQIERFDVEAVEIFPKADLDSDWVMIRITSGPVVERRSGVVAGMSGSPVYFDGRLAGAVAYGFSWPLDMVCFITPIENMLTTIDSSHQALPRVADGRLVPFPRPLNLGGRVYTRAYVTDHALPAGFEAPEGTATVQPLATPVMVSGLGSRGVEAINQLLKPYRLEAMQGPSGSGMDIPVDLQPGAALGVALVTGDVTATGVGTVTWRRGNEVLGFGHPMMQRNRVALPLTGAFVVDFFSSRQRSFKISASGDPLGTLVEDGRFGIAGTLGTPPAMIPLEVTVKDVDRNLSKTFHCQVADDPDLAGPMAGSIAQEMVGVWFGDYPRSMVTVRTTVKLKDFDPVVRQEVGVIEGSPLGAAMADLAPAINLTLGNPYQTLKLAGVELSVEVQRGDQSATIQRAWVDRAVVKPGDTVNVELDLRRRADGQIVRRRLSLQVPEWAPSGKTRCGVVGGVGEPQMAQQLKLLVPPAENPTQLLKRFAETDTDNRTLVAKLALPGSDLSVRGERFDNPPGAFGELLQQAGTTDLAVGLASVRAQEPCDLVVLNGAYAPITVAREGENPGGEQPKRNSVEMQVTEALPAGDESDPARAFYAPPEWLTAAMPTALRPPALRERKPADDTAKDKPGPAKPPAEQGQAQPKPPQPQADKGMHSRAAKAWIVTEPKDLLDGDMKGTTVVMPGSVTLGLGSEELARGHEPIFWAAAADAQGTLYLGTGNNGELLRLKPGSPAETVWKDSQPIISAVAVGPDGVWFATAPDGIVRRLGADGKVAETIATGCEAVWRLLPVPEGGVVAATGEPAKLLRLQDGKVAATLYDGGEGCFLSLAQDKTGAIYAGGEPGRIMKVGSGSAEVLQTTKEGVHALLLLPNGSLLYGDGGSLARRDPDGTVEVYRPMDGADIMDLQLTSFGVLVAMRAKAPPQTASVWLVSPDGRDRRRAFLPDALAATALVRLSDTSWAAVTGCPAIAYRLTLPVAAEGTYDSTVFDAGATAAWGAIEAWYDMPPGGAVGLETRGGDSAEPDDDWSLWVTASDRVHSPKSRYLQFRLRLKPGSGRSPTVDSVRALYAVANGAPQVAVEQPTLGVAWKGKQTVVIKVTDPNDDQPLLSFHLQLVPGSEWIDVGTEVEAPGGKHELDTTKLKDGQYRLRVTADDGVLNPDQPLITEVVSDVFLIDNTAPQVTLPGDDAFKLQADGRIVLTATAQDNLLVAGAEWRFDDGPWRPAIPDDGLFDRATELIRIRTAVVPQGKHTLEVRARDAAGAEASAKHDVEGPPKPEPVKPAAAPGH